MNPLLLLSPAGWRRLLRLGRCQLAGLGLAFARSAWTQHDLVFGTSALARSGGGFNGDASAVLRSAKARHCARGPGCRHPRPPALD